MRSLRFVCYLSMLLLPALSLAQSRPSGPLPPLIQITGVLLSPEDQPEKFHQALDVSINDKTWKLHVRDVKSLTDDNRGWSMLRDVGSFLTFSGPPALIDRLQSQETQGQPLVIEGRLYVNRRVLTLENVEPAPTQSK